MIKALITSQTRIKLLKKFFLNSNTRAHLRGLESEFDESSNSIRVELNRFEEAGLLNSFRDGNKKFYQANRSHPLYRDIHSIILKETGIDKLIDKVIRRLGSLSAVYLTGDFAQGRDGRVIELILVGEKLDLEYLERKVNQAEEFTGRYVSYTVCEPGDLAARFAGLKPTDLLLLWKEGTEPGGDSQSIEEMNENPAAGK